MSVGFRLSHVAGQEGLRENLRVHVASGVEKLRTQVSFGV